MAKLLKFTLISFLFVFSAFFLVGFVMYAVYYLYTNYKSKIISVFKRYPEVEYVVRKIASVTSVELQEDEMSNLKTARSSGPRKKRAITKGLSSRQNKILKLLTDNKKMEMSDLKSNFPKITVRTLRRDLSSLESQGRISKSGKTKGSSYTLA